MLNDSDALTPITAHPLSRALHAKYYTFLFTVYCYRLFRSANRPSTMCQPVRLDGRFQESKSGNLLHSSLLPLKVAFVDTWRNWERLDSGTGNSRSGHCTPFACSLNEWTHRRLMDYFNFRLFRWDRQLLCVYCIHSKFTKRTYWKLRI